MVSFISKNIFRGAIWMGIQTIGMKIISLVGQLILAWVLAPEDFGKIALTYSITSFAFLLQNFGISDVLINRGKSFKSWLPLAQSLSLFATVLCLIVSVILSILGGIIYEDMQLTYLILIYSLSSPFNTFSVLADSKLKIDLRFKELSLVQILTILFTQGFIIVFALFKFGVYSFVLAPVIVSIVRFFYLNYLASIKIIFKITFKHMRIVFINSFYGFIYNSFQRIIQQGDYLILGLFVVKNLVGVYYMAYSLSVQVIGFLVSSLVPILFPTLVKVPKGDIQQFKKVLLNILTYLSLLGMPFAFWQVSCSDSLITLFLEDKWKETILLVQILSIGIGFSVSGSLWAMALKLNGDFKKQAILSILSGITFILILVIFIYYFELIGAAVGVSIFNILSSIVLLYYSFKIYTIRLIEILNPIIKYFFLSFMIFGGIFTITYFLKSNNYMSLFINGIISPTIYILFLSKFDDNFKKLILQIRNNINF